MNNKESTNILLKKGKRPFTKFFINIPFRITARFLAAKLVNTKITPNMVSIFGVLCSLVGFYIIICFDKNYAKYSIPFYLLTNLAGALDGTLTRRKKMFSSFGSWYAMVSERISYIIIGLSFAFFALKATSNVYIVLLCCATLVFREGIATISILTVAKMPAGWDLYNDEFIHSSNTIIKFCTRCFFLTASLYTVLIGIGILLNANLYFVIFMLLYSFSIYLLSIIKIGKRIFNQ